MAMVSSDYICFYLVDPQTGAEEKKGKIFERLGAIFQFFLGKYVAMEVHGNGDHTN